MKEVLASSKFFARILYNNSFTRKVIPEAAYVPYKKQSRHRKNAGRGIFLQAHRIRGRVVPNSTRVVFHEKQQTCPERGLSDS